MLEGMVGLFLSSLVIVPELDINLVEVGFEEVSDYLVCLLKIRAG